MVIIMVDLNTPFAPDWVSPPGDTISDILEERGWTQKELAERLGCASENLSLMINGEVPLTHEMALKLERILGSTFQFWVSRESIYREQKSRLEVSE